MKQSDITPGVYESRDGMVRTVVEVHRNVYRGDHVMDVVRFHYYQREGQIHETPLYNFAQWAARRKDVHLVASPLLREATASCALDGETMSLDECRICRCTQDRACVTRQGPCGWAEPGLCTGCVDRAPSSRDPRVKKGDLAAVALGSRDGRSHWLGACGARGCCEVARLADFTYQQARVHARKVLGWTVSRKRGVGWVCPEHGARRPT